MNFNEWKVNKAEQILIDNGIAADKAKDVLQTVGFALLDEDIYKPKYRAHNIQWDKTDDDGNAVETDLPSDVIYDFEDLSLPDNATDNEIEDAISDRLTDDYGFCHNGFIFEKIY